MKTSRIRVYGSDKVETITCSVEDQETTINILRNEQTAYIWTSDNTMVTKLFNVLKRYPDTWKCYEGSRDSKGNIQGYFFECPKKAISFRSGDERRKHEEVDIENIL